jgi:predicted helicase
MFFYEHFLAAYDPQRRKERGVYYTPRPVINFIVNSVHLVLKQHFGKTNGLADSDVTLLDPAVGTGTFLWMAYLVVFKELKNSRKSGLIDQIIRNHLLKDFYGFEILIAAYIFSHLKLSSGLRKWGYVVREDERVPVYYTNTLDVVESHTLVPFLRELSDESRQADLIKQQKRILCVVSNPPYHGLSTNRSEWMEKLLKQGYTYADGKKDDGYYRIDGHPLDEKNPKWLQDDYVKFIRFAQWKIDTNGEGVIGYITNHGYLDSPTFRGMRRSLMNSFDKIYILNLHGNAEQNALRRTDDSEKDENVFEIKQGVAIGIFVKSRKPVEREVFYADLRGTKEHKFGWLDRNDVNTVKWQIINPRSPQYLFVPRDSAFEAEYLTYKSITEIFPLSNVGIVTARDDITVRFTPEDLWNVVTDMANAEPEEVRRKYDVGKDSDDWRIGWAKKDLIANGPRREKIIRILFRPFDHRYTFYTGKTHGFHCRPRSDIMKYMVSRSNLGIVTVRQVAEGKFNHATVTDCIVDNRVTISNKGMAYLFPLYADNAPNVSDDVMKELAGFYSEDVTPEDVFYYVYSILNSTKYRVRYAPFLKSDFPRIPFPRDLSSFKELSGLGRKLSDLHLQRARLPTTTSFDMKGTNAVETVRFQDGKVHINKQQFFGDISEELWRFETCGYQVLDKWLKSRKGRTLTNEDIEQFMQIVEIIKQTLGIMSEIDGQPAVDFSQ